MINDPILVCKYLSRLVVFRAVVHEKLPNRIDNNTRIYDAYLHHLKVSIDDKDMFDFDIKTRISELETQVHVLLELTDSEFFLYRRYEEAFEWCVSMFLESFTRSDILNGFERDLDYLCSSSLVA